MRRRKLDVFLSIVAVVTLLLNGLPIGMPVSSAADAPPPPSSPTPTVPPVDLDIAGQSRTPPSPDNLPPEVEEARARQAIEDVLEKYLRYWGPRYEVSPMDVTVAGEWAHGVAQWQGDARILSSPIHILAHHQSDGTWQALMPSTDGQYLQWLDSMPETLVSAVARNRLRNHAAEADALRPLQASPAVPPADSVPPLGVEAPAQPGPTPTPQPGPVTWQSQGASEPSVTELSELQASADDGDVMTDDCLSSVPMPRLEPSHEEDARSAIEAVLANLRADDAETTYLDLIHVWGADDWAVGECAVIDKRDDSPASGEGSVVLARRVEQGWQAALPGDPRYAEWLSLIPEQYYSPEIKQYFSPPSQQDVDTAEITTLAGSSGLYRLPYPCGTSAYVVGIHGDASQLYDIDFQIYGQDIVAARSGWIHQVVESHNECCGSSLCAACNNYVVINHGDGEYSYYLHVGQWSVTRNVGEWVNQGDVIARQGDVGYTYSSWNGRTPVPCNGNTYSGYCFTHLHFGVHLGPYWNSSTRQPRFEDVPGSYVASHATYQSGNCPTASTHLECRDNYCRKVDGDGSDQCSPEGSYCGAPPSGRWHAEYFDNPDWSGNPRCPEDFSGPFIDKDWGGGSPCGDVPSDNWSARFTSRMPFSGGAYVFHLIYDDGARLFLDGQNIWDQASHPQDVPVCPPRTLSGDHDLRLDFREYGGGASVHLHWDTDASPCQPQLPSAPALLSPSNGATFNEGQSITLSWSATGSEYYGEVLGGLAGTLPFGWQSGTSKSLGSQPAGYVYSWHVKARNSAGESAWSSIWTFTVKPAAPSNLSAQVASCTQVDLDWDDNSGNEQGYKVYRDGSYVGQVGANGETYHDTLVSENTSYSYYVKAFRGSIVSDASNTVNIATPACPPPQPDLRPYAPSGYPYPVVPSSVAGTHEVDTLHAGQPTFFDWHFINSGNAAASGTFHVELWVDSTRYVRYPYSSCAAGWVKGFDDWKETVSTPGWHTARLITDPDNTIVESDETNNVWERDFYWAPSAPYFDDMESGTNEWTATGLWHQVSEYSSPYPESHSWSSSWWYGQDSTGDYDTGSANSGDLTSPSVYIPTTGYYLRFWYRYETETQGPDWDTRWVEISVDGGPFSDVLQLRDDPMNWWLQSPAIDLSGYAGHAVQVRFRFDTINASFNEYRGWYIDDFEISSTPPPSCADAHEPNDDWTQATSIAYGQTLSADICPGGDYDFYTFSGSAGDKVVIDIDAKVDGSSLDSYIFLLDSNGTTVLAEHDDEILTEVQDSLLGYHLPHNGTYYVKVRAWNHPSVGGTDYFYDIHLFTDNTNPSSAQIVSPVNDAWLDPTLQTITASATDNESGVNRVELLWHTADWQNSDWIWLGADRDPTDGWSFNFVTSPWWEQRGGAFYIWAFDWVGNWTGDGSWNLGIDRTPPTASAGVALMYGDAPFTDFYVYWDGWDNLAGVATFDIQYRDGPGGTWTDLVIGTSGTYYRFVGADGHTYYFRARARDHAGNLGEYAAGDGDAYHLVETCPTAADMYEPDDTHTTAGWILPNTDPQVHNVHADGDQDWVGFIAFAGHTYTLTTTNSGGHADTVLYLYASDGTTLIDWNDDDPSNWPASRLEWQPSLSGVYYVKVNHWDQYAYGCTTEYGLAISSDLEAMHIAHLPLGLRIR